ncbi:MAG TPA: RdgB/HAM1 family non-canonical purine NTP pyrophosphatase [Vicinamibacterales bacterium]|nr:RdgB/HAM1 family non-canonical purine NTP pyrophosphatase [Vicinamibacterales bacterium]
MRLLVATTNRDKLREIHAVLDGASLELITLADLPPIVEPEETGATFAENARLKALYYAQAAQTTLRDPSVLTVAEDSGLVVDALDGEPGVRSARYLRRDASYQERFDAIFRRLSEQPNRPRTARFVCALAAARGGNVVFETTGTIEGEISPAPHGTNGFGYDPIFLYPPYARTLAEVDDEQKLRVAHRGHAFRNLRTWLSAAER